jgi:hypothetical protein
MKALAQLWQDHRLALLAFVASLLLVVFFAVRFVGFAIYWSDPAHAQVQPQGWMTPGYVARSWQVPKADLARELGLVPAAGRAPTLAEIAAARGITEAGLLAEVAAAIARLKSEGGGP